MRYLLDTNIVSDLVRNPQGKVAQHIRKVGEAQVCTSIVVAAELRYWATKIGFAAALGPARGVLGALEVLPFETPADAAYGLLRTRLEQAGRPMGANDLLIAAQALAFGHVIVTDNEREFAHVEDLRRENWLHEADSVSIGQEPCFRFTRALLRAVLMLSHKDVLCSLTQMDFLCPHR